MAYTKIHAIKATVDKAIDYICNPEKTDEKMFVSSYACSPETASKTLRKSSNTHSSTKTTDPIISATKKPRTRTHISADTKARSFFMAAPDVCLNRRA